MKERRCEQGGVMKKNKGEEESEAVKCVYNNAQNQNNWSEWFEVIRQANLSTSV